MANKFNIHDFLGGLRDHAYPENQLMGNYIDRILTLVNDNIQLSPRQIEGVCEYLDMINESSNFEPNSFEMVDSAVAFAAIINTCSMIL